MKIRIHPSIKAKITALLPNHFQMKALTKACNVTPSQVFPEHPRVCLHGTLGGLCLFLSCQLIHDPDLITDALADHALLAFKPFMENPKILAKVNVTLMPGRTAAMPSQIQT